MADSKSRMPFKARQPLPGRPPLAAALPLAALFGGLFLVWCLSVVWIRTLPPGDQWARQIWPILLWIGAIALYIVWQRPPQPARWLGLVPVDPPRIAIALAAFVGVFAWHAIRIQVGRPASGLLYQLPPEIHVWIVAGVVVNALLFHGVLQTRLTELAGSRLAIGVTGIAVTLFRVPSFFVGGGFGVEPGMLVIILFLALIAAILRDRSHSLWPAMALAAGNAFGTLL